MVRVVRKMVNRRDGTRGAIFQDFFKTKEIINLKSIDHTLDTFRMLADEGLSNWA